LTTNNHRACRRLRGKIIFQGYPNIAGSGGKQDKTGNTF
jgi:hypothetical protein